MLHKKKERTTLLLPSGATFQNKVLANAFSEKSYRSHWLRITLCTNVVKRANYIGIYHMKKMRKGKRERENKCTERKGEPRNQ